ncbi:flagellar biosynthesis repressor FlbT [Pinisolibacter aquiterrae]|uniref:flagellar biosynthesis repressor FlbT n=1 Tax=Pinisolibacter aquiterrae TaxID=2815579 RepID=UPI001C3CCFB4|nr:flagellar biosynthesis repressor FlbT [Pinisolibacter aquiterrae]MBV5265308.1 flagellar biosynthesis repressor FlbT [Pinisolibacter aquiterrae]MCC8235364.1 flagellar biosynthesis repressor FlbT [Pinisolibacter aquiterrae]
MTLKVEIKPGERIIIGESLITNGGGRAKLFIEGDAPILREKDVLPARQADTPAKLVYLAVQLIYLKRGDETVLEEYRALAKDFGEAAPGARDILDAIDNCLLIGDFYKGIKQAKRLIEYEEQRIHHV